MTINAYRVIDAPKYGLQVNIKPEQKTKNFPFFVDINKSTIMDSETIIAKIFKLVEIDW